MRTDAQANNVDFDALMRQFETNFSDARTAYLSLRYCAPSPIAPTSVSTTRWRPIVGGLAFAGSLLLVAILVLTHGSNAPPNSVSSGLQISKIKTPSSTPGVFKLAFSTPSRPTLITRRAIRFSMPTRPALSSSVVQISNT